MRGIVVLRPMYSPVMMAFQLEVSVDGGDDEAGVVAEAGVRIEVPEEHDDGTDLELDIMQR